MKRFLLCVILISACGSEEATTTCDVGETFNPITATCDLARTSNPLPDFGSADTGALTDTDQDTHSDMQTDPPDMGADSEPDVPVMSCTRDADQDGHIAVECGGDDCDDLNASRSPSLGEICDELDNDCNTQVNDGITCSFYAHSDTTLYRLDPFQLTLDSVGALPGLFDIDTHPDGTLYGLSPDFLYRFDAANSQWNRLPQALGADVGNANGMAIDSDGKVFITSGNKLYTADLTTGVAQFKGNMGGFYQSSGDCVVTKQDVLYMTSSHTFTDSLVVVDGIDAMTTSVGETGFNGIWGLTSAWGRLWGVTSSGDLVEINRNNGTATRVHNFAASFYGAASTPDR